MSVVEEPTEAGSTSGGGGGNIASSSILMILGFSGHLWLLAVLSRGSSPKNVTF